MAQIQFTLLDATVVNNTPVTGNGTFTLWTSSTQVNATGLENMRAVMNYATVTPAWPPNTITYSLGLVIEGLGDAGDWFPIAYQFEPFNYADNGRQRMIHLAPDISDFNAGIDDVMYVGGATIARISRQQGRVGLNWRARLICVETGYGGGGAFQSATLSLYGELY